jgi:hypothetical protein
VPPDLYEALRKQAKKNHRSISAEVIALLEQFIPTEKELKRRFEFVLKLGAPAGDKKGLT